MRTKVFGLGILFLAATTVAFAESKTEKFKVKGNCDMCELRIEKAALSLAGVTTAEWDKKTKQIEVVFDDKKTNVHKLNMAIAAAGHDTEMHKAKDEVYNKLPDCCKYDRTVKEKEKKEMDHSGHMH